MGGVVGGGGDAAGMSSQEQVMVKTVRRTILCPRTLIEPSLTGYHEQMQAAMESCPAKTVISGGMGFVMGGAFGLFMSSVCFSPRTSNPPVMRPVASPVLTLDLR